MFLAAANHTGAVNHDVEFAQFLNENRDALTVSDVQGFDSRSGEGRVFRCVGRLGRRRAGESNNRALGNKGPSNGRADAAATTDYQDATLVRGKGDMVGGA